MHRCILKSGTLSADGGPKGVTLASRKSMKCCALLLLQVIKSRRVTGQIDPEQRRTPSAQTIDRSFQLYAGCCGLIQMMQ